MNAMPVVDVLQGRVAVDSEITVRGWMCTRRDSKAGISFLVVCDGSCFGPVQVVINNSLSNYNQDVLCLTTGYSVIIMGKVAASPGQGQGLEIQATEVEVTGQAEGPDTYPMAVERRSIEYLREVTHMCPRTNMIGATAHVCHTLARALHRFSHKQGSSWISVPLITASDTEGVGRMFRVSTLDLENLPHNGQGKVDLDKNFFDKEAFLTTSGQLNGKAYTYALSRIYIFGPMFCVENSNTSRYLAELWMLEPEMAFADLNDVIDLVEAMLKYAFKAVLVEHTNNMKFFAERVDKDAIPRLERFTDTDFAQMDYTDAVDILEKCGKQFENPVCWGVDLSSEHEHYLAEEYFKVPVVMKNYPKDIRTSYMCPNKDGETVAAMDVPAPGIGEVIGGPQCEERLDALGARMLEMGLNKEDYWRYHNLRRYGTVPHSGFGLGLERLTAYIADVRNVRDIILSPHIPCNATF